MNSKTLNNKTMNINIINNKRTMNKTMNNKIMNNITINSFSLALSNVNKLRFLSSKSSDAVLNRLTSIKIIKSYKNCDTQKEDIFALAKELQDKGVVYCFENNVNNKIYVGSSTSFTYRLYKYYNLNYLFRQKTAINNALSKYGYSLFSLHILNVCDKSETLEKEQYYMGKLEPEYNILMIAGSSRGFKHSDKTLKWFKEERKVSENTKINLALAASKRVLTLDEKNKISISRLGKVMPLTARIKISNSSNKLRGLAINVHDTKYNTSKQFPSITAAAEDIKVSRTAIKKALVSSNLIKNR